MMKLTKMEKMVLNATRENDFNDCYEDNCTWAFAVVEDSGMSAKKARGVISSLIKKDLIWFQEDEEEDIIGLTEEGKKLFEAADGEECNWGGPKLLKIEDEVEEKEEVKEKEEEVAAEEHHTVTVRAFTGMMIGEFEIVRETKTLLVVKTKKGDELKFNKKTGLQTNGNNPKFANRIEL